MASRYRAAWAALSMIAVLVSGLVWLAAPAAGRVAGAATPTAAALPPDSIAVTGSADVDVAPDMAIVSFGAMAIRTNAQSALEAVNQVIAAAVKDLHALQINDRRIQTSNLSLQPQYNNTGTLTGYQAQETLAVTANSLAQVGPIVDAGVGAGANTNVSIAYGLKDETSARLTALREAISTARARAAAAASALGRSLKGAHVQLTESGPPVPRPVVQAGGFAAGAAADAKSTQTYGGTLTVHEDVTLTYVF